MCCSKRLSNATFLLFHRFAIRSGILLLKQPRLRSAYRIVMRKQPMRIVLLLQLSQSRQFPLSVPSYLPLVSMRIVDVYLDITCVSAAGWDQEVTGMSPNLMSHRTRGAV